MKILHVLLLPVFGLLLVSGLPTGPAEAGGKRASRGYRMGFTQFPWDISAEAVEDTVSFIRENADVVAVHLEGVPWTEAGAGEPFHPNLVAEWERQKAGVPPGAAVYLAVTPIRLLRDGLADYRGESEGLPVPEPYAGRAFDDPIVVDAFLAYVERAIEYFEPDWLAVGIEVDLLRRFRPDLWDGYTRLHETVYETVKAAHPDLPVFVTVTAHELFRDGEPDPGEIGDVRALLARSDLVALSYYPFLGGRSSKVGRTLRRVRRDLGFPDKPFAIAESGETAETVRLDGPPPREIPGSARGQARVVKKLLRFARKRDLAFVIWFVPRDYDALWEKISADTDEWGKLWRDCGLRDEAGRERRALRVWRKQYRRPLRTD